MLEPPNLADETIIDALEAAYGIEVAALAFLPIGNDSAAWVYRVEGTLGDTYLLKGRAGTSNARGLVVPRYLHEHGVPLIVPPVATTSGALSVKVSGFTLSLSPYLDARTGASAGLRAGHWRTLGAVVKRIHTLPPTPDIARIVGREPFMPTKRDVIEELEAAIATLEDFATDCCSVRIPPDPIAREFAAAWHGRHDRIQRLVDRADEVGVQVARTSEAHVLCHADLHTWNVLIDGTDGLWIVDWDEAILAPKERDLMFVIGGIGPGLVGPEDTECFFQGYGETSINSQALAYYRSAWAVQDIAAYGESVLLRPELGEKTRRAALDIFLSLFEPGAIVELALGSDEYGADALTVYGARSR